MYTTLGATRSNMEMRASSSESAQREEADVFVERATLVCCTAVAEAGTSAEAVLSPPIRRYGSTTEESNNFLLCLSGDADEDKESSSSAAAYISLLHRCLVENLEVLLFVVAIRHGCNTKAAAWWYDEETKIAIPTNNLIIRYAAIAANKCHKL